MLSEKEFWQTYFQSKFFHRTRGVVVDDSKEDLFDQFVTDESGAFVDAYNGIKRVDLTGTESDRVHGNRTDLTMRAGSVKESLPLIRRFNRHSEIVLKTGLK